MRLEKRLQGSLGSTEEGRKGNIGCPCLAAIFSRKMQSSGVKYLGCISEPEGMAAMERNGKGWDLENFIL